jgi:hypothetical protein
MKNNFNDIDNFCVIARRLYFGTAPELRTKVSASVRKFNFLSLIREF